MSQTKLTPLTAPLAKELLKKDGCRMVVLIRKATHLGRECYFGDVQIIGPTLTKVVSRTPRYISKRPLKESTRDLAASLGLSVEFQEV